MIDAVFVRDHVDEVRRALQSRGLDVDADLEVAEAGDDGEDVLHQRVGGGRIGILLQLVAPGLLQLVPQRDRVAGERDAARPVVDRLLARGILSKDTHGTVVRIAPPLNVPREALGWAVGEIRAAFSLSEPELGSDVAERGIVLTGGGALLRDIDKLLMEETGLPVVVAEDPLTCVARGGGKMLELIDEHGPGLFGLD